MKSEMSALTLLFILTISNLVMAQYPKPTDKEPCQGQHYFLCKSWEDKAKEDLIENGKGFSAGECEVAITWLPC